MQLLEPLSLDFKISYINWLWKMNASIFVSCISLLFIKFEMKSCYQDIYVSIRARIMMFSILLLGETYKNWLNFGANSVKNSPFKKSKTTWISPYQTKAICIISGHSDEKCRRSCRHKILNGWKAGWTGMLADKKYKEVSSELYACGYYCLI